MLPIGSFHDDLHRTYEPLLGESIGAMAVRAALIYLLALFLVRAGKSRMLSEATVFDIILIFVLGSMLSRTINGDAPVLATLVASFVLIVLHALIGRIAYHSHAFGNLVKGRTEVLVRDGRKLDDVLHSHHISDHDLDEAIHKAGLQKVDEVKLAHLERDGSISVIPRFRVVEVQVEDGVQRVRIEL